MHDVHHNALFHYANSFILPQHEMSSSTMLWLWVNIKIFYVFFSFWENKFVHLYFTCVFENHFLLKIWVKIGF